MNKRNAQSAYFNLRVLIALLVAVTGIILALVGFGAFAVRAASTTQTQQSYTTANSIDRLVPPGFDCSKIHELGIDKQMNFRAGAIMIFCGEAEGGSASAAGKFSRFIQRLLPSPLAYGTTDVNLITGTETFPNVTQSGTFTAGNPDNPLQIVVAYIDSRGRNANPNNIGGASVSTDGGNTFVRITRANGQSPFDNTFGLPSVIYNRASGTWFTVWPEEGCGFGIGYYKSATPWDPDSWIHGCIHSDSTLNDNESGWADNNPASPYYGRMYVSWNGNYPSPLIFVSYSTDNGLTWTKPQQIISTSLIRNVHITGDLVTGDVYLAAMDDMGGGFTSRANKIYRSTDGGNTWALTYTGLAFPAPGRTGCSYFPCMYYGPTYWRTSGSGEPAALNHVVHLTYASRNPSNGDPGNVFYIRSTDSGVTFSAPLQLNTDDTIRAQWQPSLSVATDGSVFATWYDERETSYCIKGDPTVPCYRIWGRKSTDNGATWFPDMPFSDVISPLPDQPDPGIVQVYAGDHDYGSSVLNQHLHAWMDGRVMISGYSQQDAFFDREPSGAGTPTPTPTPTLTPTPTSTPRATPTPRVQPTPRSHPSPAPRP
jgi:hypothetical protein